ncbi:MAG: MFS transporter [Parafilimonas terrae]|nr:MFS transporter [Parafilimonas terrae]
MVDAVRAGRIEPVVAVSLLLPVSVACGNFMTGLDQNVVITALPAIGRSLGESPTTLGLTLTAYLAALIVALPVGGWAADRFGARRAYVGAALVFTVASLLCGVAGTFWQLVAARTLQGLGGALMGTVGQTVVLSSFPRSRTLRINTYMSLAGQAAPMAGPVVGGLLTTYLSWRWVFFVNLPIGLFVVLMAARLFPDRRPGRTFPFDASGFALTGIGTALLVLGMDGVAGGGTPAPVVAAELVAGVVLLALSLRHCLRVRHPLLDPGLLRLRTFRVSLVTGGGLDTLSLTAVMFLLPLMLQVGFGMTAAQSGLLTFLAALGSISVRAFLPTLLKRFGFRRLLMINTPLLALIVAGFALLQPSTPVWLTAGLIVSFGILRSFQWGSTGNLAYAEVPPENLARFSALYYVLWQLAVALSVGSASALLAFLAGSRPASTGDFQVAFLVEAIVTLCALLGYNTLTAEDGQSVSGHAPLDPQAGSRARSPRRNECR